MSGVLAHQGEELLIPALIVAVVLLVPMFRQRFGRHSDAPDPDPGTCPYCGDPLASTEERCPACGFRVRR